MRIHNLYVKIYSLHAKIYNLYVRIYSLYAKIYSLYAKIYNLHVRIYSMYARIYNLHAKIYIAGVKIYIIDAVFSFEWRFGGYKKRLFLFWEGIFELWVGFSFFTFFCLDAKETKNQGGDSLAENRETVLK